MMYTRLAVRRDGVARMYSANETHDEIGRACDWNELVFAI